MNRHLRPLALPLLLSLACTQYQAFDSVGHVRQRYAERLATSGAGIDAAGIDAGSLEVPFELAPDVEQALEGRLRPSRKDEELVRDVVDFIFRELGLRYALVPTRNATDTFRAREGNCLSFVNLFVGIGRSRRLNPFYVEVTDHQKWRHREGTVVSQGHIVAGLYVDGKLRTYDFLPYRPKSYRDFEIVDDVTAAAHYYNNLGAEALLVGDAERAEPLLRAAHALAPHFGKAINNLGVCLYRRGRLEEAVDLYRRGLEAEPDNVALLTNLASAYQRQGRSSEADELFARLGGLADTSPYFFVYRGELALGRGEAREALELMREALRRDSELPEVHVGLVKVFLALGELERARHHVSRALQLDATHDEARHYAALLETRG